MSLSLESDPIVNSGGDDFNAIPTLRQVYYEFKREDFACTWQNDGAGVLECKITGDETAEFTNGDRIFIGDGGGVFDLVGLVASVPAFGGGFTTFDTDQAYTGAPLNRWVNNLTTHTNYRVEIDIYDSAGTTKLLEETFEYVPKQSGELEISLSDIFTYLLRKDELLTLETLIKYREVWVEDTTDTFTAADKIQIILGRQIPGSYGISGNTTENLIDYTPEDTTKKWLTPFTSGGRDTKSPYEISKRLFRGWGNFMYTIIDYDFNTRNGGDPEYLEKSADINQANQVTLSGPTAVSTAIDVYEHTIVNNNDAAALLKLTLWEDVGFNSVLEDFYLINTDECINPIMLQWLNEVGGKDQWLFGINQEVTETFGEGVLTLRQPMGEAGTDLEYRRRITNIDKQHQQKIVVSTNKLSIYSFNALKDLFRSERVDIFLTKSGSSKKRISIEPNSITWETYGGTYDLSFTIVFEPDYNFFYHKKYT